MKLHELETHLTEVEFLHFQLPDGKAIPEHFHVTEAGLINKHFIDCGGTIRNEQVASLQLWSSNDTAHRLKSEKLLKILSLSRKVLGIENPEIEIEYQSDTIGKYGLAFDEGRFRLVTKSTTCLASDSCGTTANEKAETGNKACCSPGGGCC